MALNNRQNYWQQQRAQGAPRPGAFARQRRLPPGKAPGRYNQQALMGMAPEGFNPGGQTGGPLLNDPMPRISGGTSDPFMGGFNRGGGFNPQGPGGVNPGGMSIDLNDFTRNETMGEMRQYNPGGLDNLTQQDPYAARNAVMPPSYRGGRGAYPGGNTGGMSIDQREMQPGGFGGSPPEMGVGYQTVMPPSYNAGRAPVQYQGNQQALTGQTRQQRPWGMQQQQRLNQAMQRGNFGR